jgi:threonine dehydrogenase-like Zn-dependent dehydrogenase
MIESKGVVIKGPGQADIITEDVATPTGKQVLIKTHAVGLCGSDVALYNGSYQGPRHYPLYFGHEWSGTVEAIGPDVTRFERGDKVTGDCSIFCGECVSCLRDRNLCQRIEKFGITIDGASRQYFLQDEDYIYRADHAADLDLVAISEPLAVGAHAVRRVQEARSSLKDERILVLGGGTIGLSCLFALKYLAGCQHVELFDIVEARVRKAQDLGASQLTDVAAGGGDDESYGGLYSERGYDAIFEASASPAAFRRAVELIRPLGTIMALGFVASVELSLKTIIFKAARLMGSMGGTGEFERVLAFTLRHPNVARQIITHQISFEDFPKAFELAADPKHSMKVLIRFKGSGERAYRFPGG